MLYTLACVKSYAALKNDSENDIAVWKTPKVFSPNWVQNNNYILIITIFIIFSFLIN